jgi:hypothetical protein
VGDGHNTSVLVGVPCPALALIGLLQGARTR